MTDLSDAKLGLVETVAPGITGEAPRMFIGSVAFTNRTEHAELSPTKRTRWLAFLNDRGKLVYAPAVRTFQIALMLSMGREWFERALRARDEDDWSVGAT